MRMLVAGALPAGVPLLGVALLAGCTGTPGRDAAPTATLTPSAVAGSADVLEPEPDPAVENPESDPPLPAVGVLFAPGAADHHCTAAVVHSSSGLLAVTAAHCVTGTGAGLRFVPGYGPSGSGPSGSWTVAAAYATRGWRQDRNPSQDYAVLRLTPNSPAGLSRGRPVTVEGQVGSVGTPGPAPGPAPAPASLQSVDVRGYPAGRKDAQRSCTTAIETRDGFPSVDCPDLGPGAGGVGGAPWLTAAAPATGTLVGLVGGLQQGGCSPDISYSPTFDAGTTALLVRADAGGPGDTLPVPAGSGC